MALVSWWQTFFTLTNLFIFQSPNHFIEWAGLIKTSFMEILDFASDSIRMLTNFSSQSVHHHPSVGCVNERLTAITSTKKIIKPWKFVILNCFNNACKLWKYVDLFWVGWLIFDTISAWYETSVWRFPVLSQMVIIIRFEILLP